MGVPKYRSPIHGWVCMKDGCGKTDKSGQMIEDKLHSMAAGKNSIYKNHFSNYKFFENLRFFCEFRIKEKIQVIDAV